MIHVQHILRRCYKPGRDTTKVADASCDPKAIDGAHDSMVWLKIEATRFACVDLKDFFYFFDGFGVRGYSYVTEKATRFIVNGGRRTDETAVGAE